MGSPDLISGHVGVYGEAQPLTPRRYDPGPPPPTPPATQRAGPGEYRNEMQPSPRRGRFGFSRTPRTPRTAGPTTSDFPEHNARPEPQPRQSENSIPLRDLAKQKRGVPPALTLHPVGPGISNPRNAPLLSAPLPLRNRSASNQSDRPPSMIKATVLERKIPEHLRGPRTGVPSTPYSPYMPFTPLTPMTPSRLVTKQDRKRMEKEAGRRVATVEDAVVEESEMWGDGFK